MASLSERLNAFVARVAAVVKERSLPAGGTTGQIPRKTSNADWALGWVDSASILPQSTSTTSITSTLGNVTLGVPAGNPFKVGQNIRVQSPTLNSGNVVYMAGAVTAVTDTSITFRSDSALLGVIRADWIITLGGATGQQGTTGVKGDSGAVITNNTQTGTTYTPVLADVGVAIEMSNASANTVTIPTNANVAFPIGTVLEIVQLGAGTTTIAAASGVTIRTSASMTTRVQYATVALRKRATDEWVLSGDLT